MSMRLRHDAILRVLGRNATATLDVLAREVGASRRTILRDISRLRDEGFVIHSEAGRGGGLQLDPQSLHRTARLSVTEVFALLIGVTAMRLAGNLPFAGLADSGLAKIERSLPSDKIRDLRRLLERLYIGPISPKQDLSGVGSIDSALLEVFEIAFLQQVRMRFTYRDAKGVSTVRDVEPQAMLVLPPLWYLAAWDPSRGDFRHFRMDRISAPEVGYGLRFQRRLVPFADDICPYGQTP
jgi:predicted DNA-binding transcriptional regulator YafY